MTKRLRPLIVVICVLVLGTLTACGAGDPSRAQNGRPAAMRIGVTVYDMSSFVSQGKEGMEAYAKANNIDLLWNSAGGDVGTQANQVDQLVNQGVSAIIIDPVQADSLGPQIQKAKAKKIPVIAVNAGLSDTSGLAASVLPDDIKAGEQEMQMMADKLGGKGNIVVLQGPLGQSTELDRTKGIQNVLAKYPGIKVLAQDTANWKRDQAVNRAKNWLASFSGKLNGIVSENDDMGLGALQATKEAGVTLPIVGIDGIEDGLNAVKNGEFIGTSLQHGRVEMAAGLGVAMRIAKGEQVKTPVYIMPPVTKDNVDAVLADVVTGKDKLLARLPALVDQNLQTGNIAYEGLPGQTR